MSDASGGGLGRGKGEEGGRRGARTPGVSRRVAAVSPLRAGLRRPPLGRSQSPSLGAGLAAVGAARRPPASGSAPRPRPSRGSQCCGRPGRVKVGARPGPGEGLSRPAHRGEGFWRRQGLRAGAEPCEPSRWLCLVPFPSSSLCYSAARCFRCT